MNDINHNISFFANFVNCYTENNVSVIGVGDDPNEPEHYIIISQFIEEDEDINNSIDLEGHFFNGVICGAIKYIGLKRNNLLIRLCENKSIGIDKIEISLNISTKKLKSLVEYINKIFSQSNIEIELELETEEMKETSIDRL